MSLPLPDGSSGRFAVVESPIMAAELAARFPEIRTFLGQGIDDPTATARLDVTPAGFHAMIIARNETVYIDPLRRGGVAYYVVHDASDSLAGPRWLWDGAEPCVVRGTASPVASETADLAAAGVVEPSGSRLRTYRLAVAATGEYTAAVGGTVAQGLAAIVTTVNRVNLIYERDVAVRMMLIGNNDSIVYTDPTTDPYSDRVGGPTDTENQVNLDNVIGDANYDVGHVFTLNLAARAQLGAVCVKGVKGLATSGSRFGLPGDPENDLLVAHEMGHQFGANHTFNGDECFQWNDATAYEPGSGSTIMSYAGSRGLCGTQELQVQKDRYFHSASLDEIVAYTTMGSGSTCPVLSDTGNIPPLVGTPAGGFSIPVSTPFTLTGAAVDVDGDELTYCWEEFDLGDHGPPDCASCDAPIFRSFEPTAVPSRTLPRLSDILNNTQTPGEVLPSITRNLSFRLTARDNRAGGGGVDHRHVSFLVTDAAGPFLVTSPGAGASWTTLTVQNVSWAVANTNSPPVNCESVNILLSLDGGMTFPVTLAWNTPNDGTENIVVPDMPTTLARVKVEAAGNFFFDISDQNFTIQALHSCVRDADCNGDQVANALDLQLLVNRILGLSSSACDPNHDAAVNAQDLQFTVNCLLDPTSVPAPTNLSYPASPAHYPIGTPATPNVPQYGGGPVVAFSISPALPAGLRFDKNTGIIDGTPTVLSLVSIYTVVASNTGGSTQTTLTIDVPNAAPHRLRYRRAYPRNLPSDPLVYEYVVGEAIEDNVPVYRGGHVDTFSVAPPLPAGLGLDTGTGRISGTPTGPAGASQDYVVTATNGLGSTPATLKIQIFAPCAAFDADLDATDLDGTSGIPYFASIMAVSAAASTQGNPFWEESANNQGFRAHAEPFYMVRATSAIPQPNGSANGPVLRAYMAHGTPRLCALGGFRVTNTDAALQGVGLYRYDGDRDVLTTGGGIKRFSSQAPVAGVETPTTVYPQQFASYFPDSDFVHEGFHNYQNHHWEPYGVGLFLPPGTSPRTGLIRVTVEDVALNLLQERVAGAAIRAGTPEATVTGLETIYAIRRRREALCDETVSDGTQAHHWLISLDGTMRGEGSAMYMQWRYLLTAGDGYYQTVGGLMDWYHLRVGELFDFVIADLSQWYVDLAYFHGAAIAWLLDGGPGGDWKSELETASFKEIVEGRYGTELHADLDALLPAAKTAHGYAGIVQQVEALKSAKPDAFCGPGPNQLRWCCHGTYP